MAAQEVGDMLGDLGILALVSFLAPTFDASENEQLEIDWLHSGVE